jgi:c-di-GMP-binding flagellar brake protein YcgR
MDDRSPAAPLTDVEPDDRYRVFAFAERLSILDRICERQILIRIQTDGCAEPLLSALLMVDPTTQVILFDGGRDAAVNDRLAKADRLNVSTDLDGVRVQFQLTDAVPISVAGGAAFQAAFPASILRLQRREFFRIAPPISKPIQVRLHSRMGPDRAMTTARGIDISVGGIVILIDGQVSGLALGQVFPKISITLPEVATIEVGLEVRNIHYSEKSGHAGTTRVGCRFIGLDQANVARVQRYINRLEVELRRRT